MLLHLFKKEIEQGIVSQKFVVDAAIEAGMINQRGQFKSSPVYFYQRLERQFEITLFLNVYLDLVQTCPRRRLEVAWQIFLAVLTPLTYAPPKINITDAWQATNWQSSDRFKWLTCKHCDSSYPILDEMPHIVDKCPVCRQLSVFKGKRYRGSSPDVLELA